MPFNQKAHPQDETLELYVLGRLQEPELGQLEEHMLVCEGCQERLDEATDYVSVVKAAAEHVAAEAVGEKRDRRRWFHFDWSDRPAPALAGALAVLLAVFVWQPWQAAVPAEWRTVELRTLRGSGAAESRAVAGYALDLRLEASGIEQKTATAQLVNASGDIVAELPVTFTAGKAEARYASALKAGQYWVRLKQAGETVREYSLAVEAR
ncbi:MAG: hypothetical protein HYX27_24555 [Acidobacteria bacterium]|nr:hypothetical protein [Acidobacteriota bacterium]